MSGIIFSCAKSETVWVIGETICVRYRSFRKRHTVERRPLGVTRAFLLTRIIHECRHEAFETEARRGFSEVRPTEANAQSVEETERERPRRARGSGDVAGIHE